MKRPRHSYSWDQIARMLTWNESRPTGELLCAYDRLLDSQFHNLTALDTTHESLLTGYQLLSTSQRRRFMRSPEVARYLLKSVSNEVRVSGIANELHSYLSLSDAKMGFKVGAARAKKDSNLTVTNETEIDIASNFVFPWITDHSDRPAEKSESVTELQNYSCPELAFVEQKVKSAIDSVRETSKVAGEALDMFTFRLALRKDERRPSSFSSCSFSSYPGFTVLINVEQGRIDHAQVMDALLHEAIHAIVYVFENIHDPLLYEDRPEHFRIKSPWSGNMLKLYQYVQACFVWWGLIHFWRLASSCHRFDLQRIDQMISRAEKGFLSGAIESVITCDESQAIRAQAKNGLEEIQKMFDRYACK